MAVSRRTVTVLFTDVADYTPLGERLDAESLRQVMTRFFERVSEVLERHGGTVEKYIGDAVMAVFGLPELHEDDALRAVRSGTELREALSHLNDDLEQALGVRIGIRVGINTGEVVAGDGSGGQNLVTGDPVNVAKRLEEAARTGEILVGDTTRHLVENAVVFEPRDELTVKGKAGPVVAWNALAVIEGATPYARRLDAPLVGREEELRTLRNAFAQAVREGTCHLVTVVGPAGIGKSRLTAELCHIVEGEARVLTGRCLPYGDGITFWPLVTIIDALGSDAGVRKLLAGSEDADVVTARVLGALGPNPEKAPGGELFWAVRRLFEQLARVQPLVVVIEDIHWAEPKLLDLLEYLAGWIHEAPVLLVCLARPDLLEERPVWVTSQQGTSLVLGPLSDAESQALVEELTQEWPLDPDARARVIEAAEGNPLYVEQMAAMLAEGGPTDAIPPSIQALLSARLDRLPPDERAVVERAAVAGKDFGRGSILELSPEDERAEIDARLLSLVRKDLLAARSGPGNRFRFRHALIRDAAYAGIPKELRADLHQRFADWAAQTNAGRAGDLDEIIGYHLEQAYRYREQLGALDDAHRKLAERAGELLGEAGQRAFARDDMAAALNLLDRAVALLTEEHPAQLDLQRELSSALWSSGEIARAESLLAGIIEATAASGDRRRHWYALLDQTAWRTMIGSTSTSDEELRVAQEAIRVFEELEDDFGLARSWREVSNASHLLCRFGDAEAASERALAYARAAADRREESRSTDALCTSLLYGPTPADEGVMRCEEVLAHVGGNRLMRANVLASLHGLKGMLGRFEEAFAESTEAERIYSDLGLRFAVAGLLQVTGPVALLAGDPEAAEHVLRRSYEILAGIGAKGYTAALLAAALYAQERYQEAAEFVAIAKDPGTHETTTGVRWRAVEAKLRALDGDVDAAVTTAREAASLASKTDALNLHAEALVALAEVLQLAGRDAEAAHAAEQAYAVYAAKGNVAAQEQMRALVAHGERR